MPLGEVWIKRRFDLHWMVKGSLLIKLQRYQISVFESISVPFCIFFLASFLTASIHYCLIVFMWRNAMQCDLDVGTGGEWPDRCIARADRRKLPVRCTTGEVEVESCADELFLFEQLRKVKMLSQTSCRCCCIGIDHRSEIKGSWVWSWSELNDPLPFYFRTQEDSTH